ncbi:MAG: hypothetical protein LH468_09275 [Nocardioides sp.]|nr:hypothetical protein [Nocardioides sp.]
MGWLFAQLWFWLLVSFLVGSLVAYLAIAATLPMIEEVEARSRRRGEGR